jgi:hypothetical protein
MAFLYTFAFAFHKLNLHIALKLPGFREQSGWPSGLNGWANIVATDSVWVQITPADWFFLFYFLYFLLFV